MLVSDPEQILRDTRKARRRQAFAESGDTDPDTGSDSSQDKATLQVDEPDNKNKTEQAGTMPDDEGKKQRLKR